MTSALLGVRLALTPASRLRTTLGLLATALGTLAMLVVASIARGELAEQHTNISTTELTRLIAAVVVAVSLPLVALIATVARLSASIRDHRLANLRLIGLTPGQTRTVAAAEAAFASVTGLLLGLVAYAVGQGLLHPGQRPHLVDVVVIAVAVPGLSLALAVLPQNKTASSALERARRADRKPPSPLLGLPLLAGVGLCLYTVLRGHRTEYTDIDIGLILGGVSLTGIGLLLVVPVFVRLVAGLLSRVAHGPTITVTARRLQAQPAAVARVVSALLVGLFLVTGARYVVVAFEATPQYEHAAASMEVEQRIDVPTRLRQLDRTVATARGIEGVREVLAFPSLRLRTPGCSDCDVTGIVATCTDLARIAPTITGCRNDQVTWLFDDGTEFYLANYRLGDETTWHAGNPRRTEPVLTTSARLPSVDPLPDGEYATDLIDPLYAEAIIPPSLVPNLPPRTQAMALVMADPGRDLYERLDAAGLFASTMPDFEFYDMVGGFRTLAAAVAAFILAVGLLAFAVAAIDRAVVRRRELMGLRLVGVPASLLRRSQWLEALIPVGLGSLLAVALGALAGATYLSLDESTLHMPWSSTGSIALTAGAGALLIAGLTALASVRPIAAEMIRTE